MEQNLAQRQPRQEVVIPYLPSFGWWAGSEQVSPRTCNRSTLLDPRGQRLELSVPVSGGGRLLRSPKGWGLAAVSDHGNWQHVHLGALEAAYGRTPYFIHLFPGIKAILENSPATLSALCRQLHALLERFLYGGPPFRIPLTPTAAARGNELLRVVDPDLALVDPLMKFGPETLLALEAAKARQVNNSIRE